MRLIDFTLSNARRIYSSMGKPTGVKGLNSILQYDLFFSFTVGSKDVKDRNEIACYIQSTHRCLTFAD